MASLTKHPNSRYWTACFTDRNGKQRKRSTKLTDKRKARKFATEVEEVERKAREDSMTTVQLQKVLSEVAASVTGEGIETPTVEEYLTDWLESVLSRNSKSTHVHYEKSVRSFLEDLGERKSMKLTSVTPKHIADFISTLRGSGFAPGTVIGHVKALGTAFRRADKFGLILKDPVSAALGELPKHTSSEREVFTHQEVSGPGQCSSGYRVANNYSPRLFRWCSVGRLRPHEMGKHSPRRRSNHLRATEDGKESDRADALSRN